MEDGRIFYVRNVLTTLKAVSEADLAEIQAAIDDKNARLEAERIAAEEAAKAEQEDAAGAIEE